MILWLRRNLNSLLWVLAGCFIAFLIYVQIDTSISLDYARQELKYQQETIHLFKGLLQDTSKSFSRSEMKRLVMRQGDKNIIKEEGNRILVGELIFVYSGESLTAVKLLNEDE